MISVLTAALKHRAAMLSEAVLSVKAQTRPVEHRWAFDAKREGAGAVLNRLLERAAGDWIMVLDDDDLLHPHHAETVEAHTAPRWDGPDVIYTLPEVQGGSFSQYHAPFDARRLADNQNCVSHTALVRRECLEEVGGWNDVRHFDLDLFQRLERAGATFKQIRETTWTYRLHGSNWSYGTLAEAAF